jgi:acyl carrier protein
LAGVPYRISLDLLGSKITVEVVVVASVEERVIEIVCENLAVSKDQVNRNTSFIEDIGADSLDIVELIMELEEEFEITIPDDQAEKIKTVGEAIDYIQKELEKK